MAMIEFNFFIKQKGRLQALGVLCLSLTALAVVPSFLTPASTQTARIAASCPGIVPQRADWIYWVECDAKGKPLYIEHKWPFGSPDNIKSIKLPFGYRNLLFGPSAGAQLIDNGHKESVERGYGGLFFWALLPDVTEHDKRQPPVKSSANEFDLIKGQVNPVINAKYPVWDATGLLKRMAFDFGDRVTWGPVYSAGGQRYRDVPVVSLEPRFNLNRIGPERVIIDPNYDSSPFKPGSPPHDDLWFEGEKPEISKTFILCGSDYRRNGERDPDDNPHTFCEHHFAHDGLNASVHLTYWKKHLKDWRSIEDRVSALLDSLKPQN